MLRQPPEAAEAIVHKVRVDPTYTDTARQKRQQLLTSGGLRYWG